MYKYYIDNWENQEIKLSNDDLIMINHNKFYEKVFLEDYDSEASNLFIDNKINLIMILDKNNN